MGRKGAVYMVAVLIQYCPCIAGARWSGNAVVGVVGGGTISSKVQRELASVIKIYSNGGAFTALRSDGTVRAWGASYCMPA